MKKFLFIVLFIVIFGFLRSQGVFSYTSLDGIEELRKKILSFGIMAPSIYILFYVIICLFLLPAIPVTILSGILFGAKLGVFYAIIGSSLGMAASFLSARYIAFEFIKKNMERLLLLKKLIKELKNMTGVFL